MRIFLILLGLIVAALAGGHYVLWQQQSTALANAVEQSVANLNAEHGGEFFALSFESKTNGGYPMDAHVTFTNPVLTIKPEFYAKNPAFSEDNTAMPTFNTVALNGDMVIRNNYISNESGFEFTGDALLNGTEYGEPVIYKIRWDDTASASFKANDTIMAFITNDHALAKAHTFEEKLKAIKSLDMSVDDLHVHNATTDKHLFEIASMDASVTSAASDYSDNHKIGLQTNVKEAEFFTTQEDTLQDMRLSLEPLNDMQRSIFNLVEKHPLPILQGDYAGKQNIVFDAIYDGPVAENAKGAAPENISLSITRFDVESDAYTMSFPFTMNLDASKGMRLDVRHDGTTTYKPKFDEVMAETAQNIITILHSPELDVPPQLRTQLKMITPELLAGVIPQWSAWGALNTQANFKFDENTGDLSIDSAGFNAAPFGLEVKGTGNLAQQKGDGTIIFTHLPALFNSLVAYANNAQKLVSILEPNTPAFIVNEQAKQALISFVSQYDTDQSEETTTLTLKSAGDGNIMISGQPAGMVFMAAMGQLGPHFQALMPR